MRSSAIRTRWFLSSCDFVVYFGTRRLEACRSARSMAMAGVLTLWGGDDGSGDDESAATTLEFERSGAAEALEEEFCL